MFRRLWSGLPKDPEFPSDLKGLGYFINEKDEVRSIENSDNYFKYFLSRNPRHNERQRYAINEALEKEVHSRLEALGLEKVLLPFGTMSSSEPHVPIFMSTNLKTKSRVVLIFGETMQDLGMLAHRVIGGPGGVDKGSLVSVVRALQGQKSGPGDDAAPGIILANTSQLVWSPQLKRALCQIGAEGAPRPSAVHGGMLVTDENRVPDNHTAKDHVRYVFEKIVPACTRADAALEIIGLGDGADVVEDYLDWGVTWGRLQGRIRCFAILGGYKLIDELQCESFKTFLREKACAWVPSLDPLGTLISGPDGNPHTTTFSRYGCPVYSSGEPCYIECLLIKVYTAVLDWLQAIALTPNGGSARYVNPIVNCTYADEKLPTSLDPDWSEWQDAPLDQQPPIDFGEADPRANISGDEDEDEGEGLPQKRKVDDDEDEEDE